MSVVAAGMVVPLSRAADAHDVLMVFHLVLGRRPGRSKDVEYHLDNPLGHVLAHVLSSSEFQDRVFPFLAGDSQPLRKPLVPGLADWAAGVFGPQVASGDPDWPELLSRCLRSPAFIDFADTRPSLRGRFGAAMSFAKAASPKSAPPAPSAPVPIAKPAASSKSAAAPPPPPAEEVVRAPAPTPRATASSKAAAAPPSPAEETVRAPARASGSKAAPATVPAPGAMVRLLLCSDVAVPVAPSDDTTLIARRVLLSSAFATTVLGPLAAQDPLPAAWADPVPAELRALADGFFNGKLAHSNSDPAEPWTRLLARLLRHADSDLRPDVALWQGLNAADVQALAGAVDAALQRLSAEDAALRHPAAFAAATTVGADALFRFTLGRPPSKRDNLREMAQRGYLATIQRLILSPEFERVALRPMAAGRTLRHVAESELAADHAAALSTVLGIADQVPKNWAQEMALALGSPELLSALRRIPVSRGQEEQRTYVFDTLARLAEEARKPPPVRVFVDYRDERRVVVFCRNLPKNRQLKVDVSVSGPQELSFSAIARPVTDARSEAVFSLPVPTLAPHTWSGTAICHFHDPREPHANLPACAPLPIRVAMSSAVLEKVQAAAVTELKRVQYLLDGGRRREALSLLARIQQDTPTIADAQVLAATAAAVAGELDQAVAMVELLPRNPAADELRARLYVRTGRIGEASALLDQLAPVDGLRGRALALLAEACRGAPSGDGAQALMPAIVLREAALRLTVRPAQSAAAFAVALCASEGVAEREALARDVIAALALCFAPGAGIAELIREVDQHGLLPLSRFVADSEVRKLGYLLLPALCELAPERIAHADLLLALSRTLDAAGRTPEALRFAEEAAWLGKESFDAHIVAAQLNQRLRAPDAAIQQLEAALRLKPGDARTMERLLSLEIEAKKLDPLRSSERHDALLAQSTELAQAALLKAPRDPATRLEYARFAALAERFDEARGILRGLADDNPDWPAPVLLLMRIAQQLDQHEDVLQLFARLPPQEVDDRAVMWAAKSHRGLGAVTQAHDLLASRLDRGGAPLRREYVRNLFFEGRFEEALQAANRMLDGEDRHDLELRFLAAAACLELRQNEMAYFHTAWIQLHGGSKLFPLEMPLFLYAVMQRTGDPSGALSQLDPMFGRVGAQRIRLDTRLGSAAFDQLCPTGIYPESPGPHAPLFQGPKVSVIMTTFNVENYVHTAVRSILQQTYRNLELIIIDDASTDRTPAILAELERSDPRVKIILKSTNDGTYVSKNMGLLQSQGEFVAFQDSDDWSHPDRLACSIGVLMRNPSVVALTTDWLRMTTDGDIVIKAGGQISHVCCISLVARRAPMLNQVGFFDSVRIAADLELIQRLSLAFGSKAVPRLRWPLLLGRARSDSLTASEEFGISRTGFTEPRQLYHRYADEFHTRIAAGASPYIPFPLRRRLFDAPAIILPTRDAA